MTPEQKAAYIQAQATCALIEALGYMSLNMQRAPLGYSMAYDEEDFTKLINTYGIHHNNILELFRD